jgi:P-aminobenzoate N-oxygenase AurF
VITQSAPVRPRVDPWGEIEFPPAPVDRFVAPEDHWPAFAAVPMSLAQRVAMNNLALRFSCEMVAHFEQYVVDYLESQSARFRGALSDRARSKFAADERIHINGFLRLLAALRPSAYPEPRLAFFRWDFWDRAVVRWAPAVTFFVATDLLEEMFLHVHTVMDERPEQTFAPARAVMALHAREELRHLGWDEQVITARRGVLPGWRFALEALASMLIVLLVDAKTARSWRRAVRAHAGELGLTKAQARSLACKRLSRSDVMGLEAFIERRRRKPFPGSRLLCAVLSLALPRP